MIKTAWKFFFSMVRHQFAKWQGYEVFTPKAALGYRTRRCNKCGSNEDGQCMECKCLVISKTVMALEACPLGRWSRVWVKRGDRRFGPSK